MTSTTTSEASSSSSSSESSRSRALPDKKTFIATLSGTAFVVGLTGATIYGLRKARIQALKEAQEAAAEASTSSSVASSSSHLPRSSLISPPTTAAASTAPSVLRRSTIQKDPHTTEEQTETQQGAFALFKQMNAAILSPSRDTASHANVPKSVFDDESNSSLPGVLRRRRSSPTSSSSSSSSRFISPMIASSSSLRAGSSSNSATASLSHNDTKIDYSEMDSTLDFLGLSSPVPAEEQRRMQALESAPQTESLTFFQSPVGLSLKAFFIATALVTGCSLAVVELTRRVLGVETMDDFVLAMARIVPGRTAVEQSFEKVAPHMKTKKDMDLVGQVPEQPKSLDEALNDLAQAEGVEDWFKRLRSQLDAERDYEVRRRFRSSLESSEQTLSNDAISSSSNYAIHSPLESYSELEEKDSKQRFSMGISPVLPSTGFGVGLVSGMITAGKRAGLVFMAENAHRLPDTVQGWYFYTKTKNYKVLLGAIQGGLKQGTRLGIWTTGFCLAERAAELTREKVSKEILGGVQNQQEGGTDRGGIKVAGHWTDGAVAGLATAGIATTLYRLPKPAAVRVFQLGLMAGATTGGIRDIQERLLHKQIGGVARHT